MGIPDLAKELAARDVGFVLRTYPDHSLLKFCQEVRAGHCDWRREPHAGTGAMASQSGEQAARAPLDGGCGRDRTQQIVVEGTIRGAHHPSAPARSAAAIPGAANEFESSRALDFSTAPAFAFAPRRRNSRIGNWITSVRSGSRLARWKQAGLARPAGIREPAPGRLSRGPQPPRSNTAPASFLRISTSGTSARSRLRAQCSSAARPSERRKRFSSR